MERLHERAQEIADVVAGNAPLSMQAIKQTVLESQTQAWPDAFQLEMEQSAKVMMSKDARKGPRAFKKKHPPVFISE